MSDKSVHVYKATNKINGKVYIGITSDLVRRKRQHNNSRYGSKNTVFSRALSKYGWDSFQWDVIETCPSVSEANDRERFWINYYNSIAPFGYNICSGGGGTQGFSHPQTLESRLKISAALKGRTVSNETRLKISQTHKGKLVAASTREKQSISQIQRFVRDGSPKNVKLSFETAQQIRDLYSRGVKGVDLAELYNVSKSLISTIVNGKSWVAP